jgi:hypothetical protein
MRFNAGFTDSDLAAFAHETDRRTDGKRPPKADAGDVQRLLRSPGNTRDKSLSTLAQAWRERLPAALRPSALCEHYPRIANRLALCWDDATLTRKVFEDLLADRRGNRRGYPAEVRRELLTLSAAGR